MKKKVYVVWMAVILYIVAIQLCSAFLQGIFMKNFLSKNQLESVELRIKRKNPNEDIHINLYSYNCDTAYIL